MPTSSAETIVGSPMELVNGSGNFTWTSQNFPALRSGDTLTIRVVNNMLEKFHTENFKPVSGINYTMKKTPLKELLTAIFPSANKQVLDDNYDCITYLTNYYCKYGDNYNGLKIDTSIHRLYKGDILKLEDNMEFNIYQMYYGEYVEGIIRFINPKVIIYITINKNNLIELQGIVQFFDKGMTIPYTYGQTYGKLMVCNGCSGDTWLLQQLTNKDDIILSEGINDVSDELKIVKNGSIIYPSANIIKRSLNVEYIPAPTPTPTQTPILTTPIQTPTPTPTVSNTPTSTPTLTSTLTPTPTQITTPTPTSTSQLEQEVKELKERLNKTEEKQSQQEGRISWLESAINSILDWLKSII